MIKVYCNGCDQEFHENEQSHETFIPIVGQVVMRVPVAGVGMIEKTHHLHFCAFDCIVKWAENEAGKQQLPGTEGP